MNGYDRLKAFIEKHATITIFSHIYPDGDAIGSLIGLRELILENYPHKKVYALGSNIKPHVDIVGPTDEVTDDVIKNSAAIVVDIANSARVEDQRFKLAKGSFKVDHHIFAEKFTDDEIVDTTKIATCEMLGEFAQLAKLKVNKLAATALLLGIITDSGRFFYDATSALTFSVSAFLLENGADFLKINEHLGKRRLGSLKERGYIMYNYKTYENIIYIFVDYKQLLALGLAASDGTNFVNTYRSIDEFPIWVTFFEDKDGRVFTELRSAKYNVQQVAKQFGGGGHVKASGCRLASQAMINDVLVALTNAEELSDV